MKILGIDTSSMAASVAVIEDNKLICEYTINTKKTHSQKLMPMIENMLSLSDLNVRELDAIAVCEGPGSFTGLRIGMATAKAIAHVNDIPVIGVNSLEVLAANMNLCDKKICSILDAQRNQVYTGRYHYEGTKLVEIKEIGIQPIDELLEELAQSKEEWILVGEAVYKYEDKIREIENIEIPAPAMYDEALKAMFGDYMIPVRGGSDHDYPFYGHLEGELKKQIKAVGFDGTIDEFCREVSSGRIRVKTDKRY